MTTQKGEESVEKIGIDWNSRADITQDQLVDLFWNSQLSIMDQHVPCKGDCNEHFIYWWHAHVIDVLTDGYERTRNSKYIERIDLVIEGVRRLNGNTLIHNYYDDMEWMALALLRVYDVTQREIYKELTMILWVNIQTAWNDQMGGGMAWKKDQLYYKNTPANAPASILASRLYQRFNQEEDLYWARKIYHWNKDNLVDPSNGFVWDGLNRLGDGKIDYDWEYTYCQGVFIGAGIELYHITGETIYLEDAVRTAETALLHFVDQESGMLPNEGEDDCGLFKGIFVRYLHQLLIIRPEHVHVRHMLLHNATVLWESGRNEKGLISRSWKGDIEKVVQLCAQLSGIMLIEVAASIGETQSETN
ncbi:MAG: glycoside hydrolase family 76 protein [Paenibacillaceae bacterium]